MLMHFWNEHYLFLVVAIGLSILSIASSIIGSSLVLEKQSQLGDAIGHAAYPGVIIAFALFQNKHPFLLISGGIGASVVALFLIHYISKKSHFQFESILALILSSFFGLGMVLLSYIQGNPTFSNVSQAGLNHYILGQAAYLITEDIISIGLIAIGCLLTYGIFYRRIKIVLFDTTFAETLGIPTKKIRLLNLFLAIIIISIGLKAVGALLISSLLITPTLIALQWTQNYARSLWIASISALFATLLGTWLSTHIEKLATGPTVVLCLFAIAMISMVIGPYSACQQRKSEKYD